MFSDLFSVRYSTGVHFDHKNYFFCPKAKVYFFKYSTYQVLSFGTKYIKILWSDKMSSQFEN